MTEARGLTLPDVGMSVLHFRLATTTVTSVVLQAKIACPRATHLAAIAVTIRTQSHLLDLAVTVPAEAITRAHLAGEVVSSLSHQHHVHPPRIPITAV